MRSLQRWAVRPLLLATLALVALAAWSASAQAGVVVTIQPPGGGSPAPISTDAVSPDVTATYTVGTASGGTEKIYCAEAYCVSVLELLEKARANFDYATIEVPRMNGGRPLRLTREQIEDPDQPVFYIDDQGVTRFIGAPDREGDGEVAVDDYFEVGAAITITQHRPSKIKVRISPTEKKVEPGESVTFKARVTGAEQDEHVVFTWGLKGGKQSSDGATHTHEFPEKDGAYKLLVSASIEGSDDSVTDVANVTVGDPKKSEKNREGGGDNQTGTEDSGAATGESGGGSTYDGGTSAPTYTPTAPAPYTPPAPPPTTTPEPSPPSIATDGSVVEGNLLADASDPPSGSILESAARAARDGTPRDSEESGGDIPEAALSLAGALALLGLGAGLESRQGRPLRLRLPRRAA